MARNSANPKGVPYKFDEDARQRFLDHLSKTGRVYDSAKVAGVNPATVYIYCDANPEYAEAIEQAKHAFRDLVTAEVFRRGVSGVTEPVYQQGEKVGSKQVYSDAMLTMLAKRYEPEFRERSQIDLNHKGGVLVVGQQAKTDAEWHEQYGDLKAEE